MSHTVYCYKCLEEILPTDESHYGLHARPCFQSWFQDAFETFEGEITLPTFQCMMLKTQQSNVSNFISSNFLGRYRKYSAKLGSKHYILKVQEADYPELPMTEYLCNQIADFLNIPVPRYYLLKFENEQNHFVSFVVNNFMQNMIGADLEHIYRYLGGNTTNFNCENILSIIENNSNNPEDVRIFIEMCLFDALIGNHDRHGRNLGFIVTSKGKSLAPIYDNPSYIGIEEYFLDSDLEPRGKIITKISDNPSMKDYIIEFNRLGYQSIISGFKEKMNLSKIIELINNSFVSQRRKNAFRKLINKRYLEFEHA